MIFTELAEGQLSLVVAMYVCLCVCVSIPKVSIVNYAPTVQQLECKSSTKSLTFFWDKSKFQNLKGL